MDIRQLRQRTNGLPLLARLALALGVFATATGCAGTNPGATTTGATPTSIATTSLTPDPTTVAIASIENYLAGEHAAIWAYGRAASLLPMDQIPGALKRLREHEVERDHLIADLKEAGVKPVGALAAYDANSPLQNAEEARVFLSGVEARLAALALAVKSIPSKP